MAASRRPDRPTLPNGPLPPSIGGVPPGVVSMGAAPMPEKKPLRVFVSSTTTDLVEHRRAVIQVIRRFGQSAVAMEDWNAAPGRPADESTRRAAAADLVVCVVGWRYGYVPPVALGGDGVRSITWLEVDAARAAGKGVLAFVADPAARWPHPKESELLDDAETDEDYARVVAAAKGLKGFRKHLGDHFTWATFDSVGDLAAKGTTALHERLGETVRVPPDALLGPYLREVVLETQHIDIQGIVPPDASAQKALMYPIEELYTPLRPVGGYATPWGSSAEDDEPRDGGNGRFALTDVLAGQRRLLVIGEPGAGKTTFLRLAACVLARDAVAEPGAAPGRLRHLGLPLDEAAPIPVFVRLAALVRFLSANETTGDASTRCLVRYLTEKHGAEAAAALEAVLDDHRGALLLDGLDEVVDPEGQRRVTTLVDHVLERWGRNRVVVTSRPYGFEAVAALRGGAFATVRVADFEDDDIRRFLERWVAGLPPASGGSEDYRDALVDAIVRSRPVRRLARNPVMLTCLCVVHWHQRRLPEGKYDLLRSVLHWLLHARAKAREKRGWTNALAEQCFTALAAAMTLGPEGKRAILDLHDAAEALVEPLRYRKRVPDDDTARTEARRFLADELLGSGIVIEAGEGQLKFWHLTFQEHLAARSLADRCDAEDDPRGWWPPVRDHLCDRQWSEILDHLAGALRVSGPRQADLLLRRTLATVDPADLAATARAVGAAGRFLQTLAAYDYAPPPDLGWEEARERVMAIFTPEGAARVPVATRIAAAEALGQAGDPRLAGPVIERMLAIPGKRGALLGRYPVTVREFADFVEDEGYADERWWDAEGRRERKEREWTAPAKWDDQLEHPNRPVIHVSWHEAVAYGRWLAALTSQPFRLPTEAEWFAAAKNSAGEYPWGQEPPTADHANFAPGGKRNVGAPSPVGVYPRGAAPGGHLDLAGNVWEWCDDDRGSGWRALRGGGWDYPAEYLRSAFRNWNPAGFRNVDFGFRLALSPASR